MKFLGIESRDVYIAVEFSSAELQNLARFFEKGLPVFEKVYSDTEQALIQEIFDFNDKLEMIIERVKEKKQNGS